jgi:hypothetical protein
MTLLFILQQADYANQKILNMNPNSKSLEGVFSCTAPTPCINILFTPDTPRIRSFLTEFAKKNAERTNQPELQMEAPLTGIV